MAKLNEDEKRTLLLEMIARAEKKLIVPKTKAERIANVYDELSSQRALLVKDIKEFFNSVSLSLADLKYSVPEDETIYLPNPVRINGDVFLKKGRHEQHDLLNYCLTGVRQPLAPFSTRTTNPLAKLRCLIDESIAEIQLRESESRFYAEVSEKEKSFPEHVPYTENALQIRYNRLAFQFRNMKKAQLGILSPFRHPLAYKIIADFQVQDHTVQESSSNIRNMRIEKISKLLELI